MTSWEICASGIWIYCINNDLLSGISPIVHRLFESYVLLIFVTALPRPPISSQIVIDVQPKFAEILNE